MIRDDNTRKIPWVISSTVRTNFDLLVGKHIRSLVSNFTVLTRSLGDMCKRYEGTEGDLPSKERCQTDFVAREYGTLF